MNYNLFRDGLINKSKIFKMKSGLLKQNRLLIIFFSLLSIQAEKINKQDKPNILFIAVDDLRPDFGAIRNPWVKTPNIDQLSSEGLYFNRAYCQYPVCGPSRSSIMTGMLPDHSGIFGFENADSKVGHVTILPQLFKDHGYKTGRFGKVFNNPMDFKEAWDEKPRDPVTQGYSWKANQYVLPENKEQLKIEPSIGSVAEGKNQSPNPPAVERADYPDKEFIDYKTASQGIDFIKQYKDEPFFCAVGFKKPHLPFSAPERCWKMYDHIEVPYATNPFLPKRTENWMACNWEELRSYSDIPNQGLLTLEKGKELIQGYFATVSFVDDQIGRLLKTLDELGLRKNTIVVFWSDHSFHLGENGIWAKHVNWELTNRIPVIISLPEQKTKGEMSDALVELIDLYPTIADLAGLPLPQHLDGKSLKPLLHNPKKNWSNAALSQYKRGDKMSYSIRTERYRYSEWRKIGLTPPKIEGKELYDLKMDPQGNVNLAASSEHADIIAEHAKILQAFIERK